MRISRDKVVSIDYRMLDRVGNLIDSSDDVEPLAFIQGRGKVLPALEAKVEGHAVGDRLSFTLAPDQAFGWRDEKLIRQVPRNRFAYQGVLKLGMTFTRGSLGHRQLATVLDMDQETVTIDANHPLAGQCVHIDLVVIDVREAIEAELTSGEVQEMADIFAREQAHARRHGVAVKGPVLGTKQ